jgi:hypothetical protein
MERDIMLLPREWESTAFDSANGPHGRDSGVRSGPEALSASWRIEIAQRLSAAANLAAFLLLFTLRFGWALVPMSFCLAVRFHRDRTVETADWQAVLLLILLIAWTAAASGFAYSRRRAGRV